MPVSPLENLEELATIREEWDALSHGISFRSWAWLCGWWQPYQGAGQLWVLAVRDEQDRLIGIAPWYLTRSVQAGTVVRSLGGGEVCSDHVSILASVENKKRVAHELADYLARQTESSATSVHWDAIELEAIDEDDSLIEELVLRLGQQHQMVIRRVEADNCWRVELPSTWEDYVALQSKSHRKQLRRFERRVLDSDRATLHCAQTSDELETAWNIFVDLHQRRRNSLGEPGCFASESFTEFHRQVAENFLAADRLRLYWLELDGKPIAAEYQFAGSTNLGDQTIYAYQSGVDPERLEEEPGRLIMIATIQAAIKEGRTAMDFLRGDEPYKAHWRATPQKAYDVRIVPQHASARVRDGVQLVLGEAKSWVKSSLEMITGETS